MVRHGAITFGVGLEALSRLGRLRLVLEEGGVHLVAAFARVGSGLDFVVVEQCAGRLSHWLSCSALHNEARVNRKSGQKQDSIDDGLQKCGCFVDNHEN